MTLRCYHSPEKANIGGERNRDSFRELLRGLPSLPPLLIFMCGLVQERESKKNRGRVSYAATVYTFPSGPDHGRRIYSAARYSVGRIPLFYRPSHCTIFGDSTVILYEQEQYFFLLSGIADD
ncbi:hypothetical protein DKU50_24970 [Salmonella enterica subsp. enterica serovar Albany]|nr:hypothetical protein [Salmonella enterica subsp. enterica serovar Albany]